MLACLQRMAASRLWYVHLWQIQLSQGTGSATVTTFLHPGTGLQEESEEAAMCEETLEAQLAGSETSITPCEETPHERDSTVRRQSESQVAHDSWGALGRSRLCQNRGPAKTPLLVAAIPALSWNCNWMEILDTHLDYVLNPWKWPHCLAASLGEHYSYSRLMHQLVKTDVTVALSCHGYMPTRIAGAWDPVYASTGNRVRLQIILGLLKILGRIVVALLSRSSAYEGRLFLTNRASISA